MADPSVSPADTIRPLGYCHVRKEDLHGGSALDRNPPFASFDVVHRRDYDALLAVGEQKDLDFRALEMNLKAERDLRHIAVAVGERDKAALVSAATVLEVLAAQIVEKPYRELTPDFQEQIVLNALVVRNALLTDGAALTSQGERDRQHIRDLTEKLRISYPMTPVDCLISELRDEFHHDGRDGRYILTRERFEERVAEAALADEAAAVLAGEENAAPATLERRVTVTICDDCSCQAKKVTGGWSCPCCGDGATVREATVTALVPVRAAGEEDTP